MARSAFPPVPFPDYALLDSGGAEKLERFGGIVLRRPDPQALWKRFLPDEAWNRADLCFVRDETSGGRGGKWTANPRSDVPGQWSVRYADATFVARPTPFKHVGIFPEQAPNWDLVHRALGAFEVERPRLLNLFGYTGVASVLAVRAEYEVTHLDASKASLAWARENLTASGFAEDAMKIVLDDALGFAQREARRGSRYHAVLLDPPHYGRGPRGEKWQFEDSIAPLVAAVRGLIDDRALVILSSYAIGCSPITLENLLADLGEGDLSSGELVLREESPRGRSLPAGFCAPVEPRSGSRGRSAMKKGRGRGALRVLYCDNHLLVVAKHAGIPSVPDASGDESLLERAKEWVRTEFAKPGAVFLGVVQRLDRPVSGIVVFARTSKAAARLSRSLRERTARKVYRAVAEGRPREAEGVLEQWLEKDESKNRVRAVGVRAASAKHAVTRWRVLAHAAGRTLYEFVPETGRPHQLRACAAALGTPLVGDLKYGAREALPDASIALHAAELEVEHPTRGEQLRFADPPPRRPPWDLFRLGTSGRRL